MLDEMHQVSYIYAFYAMGMLLTSTAAVAYRFGDEQQVQPVND